jgi:hypothetical protein
MHILSRFLGWHTRYFGNPLQDKRLFLSCLSKKTLVALHPPIEGDIGRIVEKVPSAKIFCIQIPPFCNNRRSGYSWFIVGFLLGPFGLIFALVASKKTDVVEARELEKGEIKKCSHCAELIKAEAVKCRYCGEAV